MDDRHCIAHGVDRYPLNSFPLDKIRGHVPFDMGQMVTTSYSSITCKHEEILAIAWPRFFPLTLDCGYYECAGTCDTRLHNLGCGCKEFHYFHTLLSTLVHPRFCEPCGYSWLLITFQVQIMTSASSTMEKNVIQGDSNEAKAPYPVCAWIVTWTVVTLLDLTADCSLLQVRAVRLYSIQVA